MRYAHHRQIARADLTRSLGTLVETLAQAHELAAGGAAGEDLAALLVRARCELDSADEKLLVLDRRRQRSMFRRAALIRLRIARLQQAVAAPPS